MDEVSVNLRFALEKASGCDIMSDGHKVVKDNNRYRCKEMEFKTYEYLAEDAKMIRQIVFMQEQGFVDEFDDTDLQATQIVLYDERKPIATCRIFPGNEKNAFILGRLAVLKEYRGKNIGAQMLQKVEKVVAQKGGTSISLHAQCRVQKFYQKCGYTVFGEVGEEEKCPHIWMSKQI